MYHPLHRRKLVVEEKLGGKSLALISEEQSVPYSTVCRIWQSYQSGGWANVELRYSNCGPKRPKFYRVFRMSTWLRRKHPTWGAPYILTMIAKKYPELPLPSVRIVQKWLRKEKMNEPRTQRAEPTVPKVEAVHDCWQIDAKEKIQLHDGNKACYLTMVDVKSGGIIDAPVFPLRSN